MVLLKGIPKTQLSTPDGLVILNAKGQCNVEKKSTIDFLAERIKTGGLVGYEFETHTVETEKPKAKNKPQKQETALEQNDSDTATE